METASPWVAASMSGMRLLAQRKSYEASAAYRRAERDARLARRAAKPNPSSYVLARAKELGVVADAS